MKSNPMCKKKKRFKCVHCHEKMLMFTGKGRLNSIPIISHKYVHTGI